MSYRSSEKTRKKKDAKRTAMMQAAVRVFAEKGYHSATVRDVVKDADVAIGTFYFYFPDKETLFVYLYEETADFLLQTIQQTLGGRSDLAGRVSAAANGYMNLAVYEPSIVNLLLVGGIGAVPSLAEKRTQFRERLMRLWQNALDEAIEAGEIEAQDTRFSAEFIAGGFDEIILSVLSIPNPEARSTEAAAAMTALALRAVGGTVEN